MKKKATAILLALVLAASALPLCVQAATTTKLIPCSIPKTFPTVKMDPTFTLVNFWHAMGQPNGAQIDNICNWFNASEGKKKKIYVKAIFQGDYDSITVKIQATLQSGNVKDLPDLVQLSSQGAFSVKDSPRLVYMEDLIKADKSFTILDKLNPGALWSASYKGKQLGMPFNNSVLVLFYNADAYKAAGLDPKKPPKTLADFTEYAKKLVIWGTGKKPVRYGCVSKIYTFQSSCWIPRQKKGTAFQFDMEDGHLGVPTKFVCGYDGTLKAMLTEWGKALKTPGAVNYNSNTRADFTNGYAAMFSGSIMGYELILSDQKAFKDRTKVFEPKMASMPVVNADDSIATAPGGASVYMFDKGNAKTKDATWQFVKFLTTVDVCAYWYTASGYFPLNKDALNTQYVQDVLKKLPEKKIPLQMRADSEKFPKMQEPWIPSQLVYSNMLGDQCSLIGSGKITVDQAVANLTKKAESLLKVYHDANG